MNSWQRWHIDRPLFLALCLLSVIGIFVLYSASGESTALVVRHALRLALGFAVLVGFAQIRPETLRRWSPYIFAIGLALLVAVLVVGSVRLGARRWLNLGLFRFQPSEIMKLGMPMMLAWYFAREPLPPKTRSIALGGAISLLPILLVAKQPDLGTAALILGSVLAVLFLAGMSWRSILTVVVIAGMAAPLLWAHLHQYQKQRIITLLNPSSDPLGAGYHTIQSMIAVGSGGFFGKGWLKSSQARLDFLPESSTDFIFAVFAEEFGFLGILMLCCLYLFVLGRSLLIAFYAQDTYARLLAGGLALTFFMYFFVNIGMVSGILPVVGVPLPLISYGGSATVTLMAAFGMLMSIHTHRKMMTQ
ncbi:MAG: rod shape-determining protein RodA [Gammaproteobacteria bacterium]|nr:rod shape-determining protein RodA [Gammaproteobacteria bacterium]